MRWLLLSLVISCAHNPPPAPKPERPLDGPGALAGKYTAGNDLDWGYFLEVSADGTLHLEIDRGKMGRCVQVGTLVAGSDAHTFTTAFTKNECDRDHAGQPLTIHVDSFNADQLDLTTTGEGVLDHRHYTPRR